LSAKRKKRVGSDPARKEKGDLGTRSGRGRFAMTVGASERGREKDIDEEKKRIRIPEGRGKKTQFNLEQGAGVEKGWGNDHGRLRSLLQAGRSKKMTHDSFDQDWGFGKIKRLPRSSRWKKKNSVGLIGRKEKGSETRKNVTPVEQQDLNADAGPRSYWCSGKKDVLTGRETNC